MKVETVERFKRVIADAQKAALPATVAKVLSVDMDMATCKLEMQNADDPIILENVRLRSVANNANTGVISYPKAGSFVVVGFLHNNITEAFVIAQSEVEVLKVEINGKLCVKNTQQSLKELVTDLFSVIESIKVITPQGPAYLSPDTKLKLNEIEMKFKQLLK